MKTKICTVCKGEFPAILGYFWKGYNKSGLSSRCSSCMREADKRTRKLDLEKRRAQRQKWLDNNPEYRKKWKKENAEAELSWARTSHLKNTFNLTVEQFEEMRIFFDKRCYICQKPEEEVLIGKWKYLCIDHDHSTGEIRGLLCNACNVMLSRARDDVRVLSRAIEYLKDPPWRKGKEL